MEHDFCCIYARAKVAKIYFEIFELQLVTSLIPFIILLLGLNSCKLMLHRFRVTYYSVSRFFVSACMQFLEDRVLLLLVACAIALRSLSGA